jgi:hypothetical protein
MSASLAARVAIKLDRELSWRKRELISIYMDVPDDESIPLTRMKCRQALVLLYSHWEGFAKQAFGYYLDEISRANLDPRQLRPELLGLSLQIRMRNATERRVPHEIGKQLKSVIDPNVVLPRIPVKGIVRTRSNLSGTVLREILEIVGLDPMRYVSFEADPIQILLTSRNAIAHGQGLPVPVDSYRRLHHSIIDLMDNIRVYLEDNLASSTYLA